MSRATGDPRRTCFAVRAPATPPSDIGTARFDRRGSIPFPADGPEFLAIGALEQTGRRAVYSSCGPNSAAPKPDFVALVPVLTACRGKPFAGTSAAAPQAAALAALCLSRH